MEGDESVIPAQAGIQVYSPGGGTPGYMECYFLDSRFRGNDTLHLASASPQPASPAGGDAGCFIRLKCDNFLSFSFLFLFFGFPRRGSSRKINKMENTGKITKIDNFHNIHGLTKLRCFSRAVPHPLWKMLNFTSSTVLAHWLNDND